MKSEFDWKEFEKKAEMECQIKEKFENFRNELIQIKDSPFIEETNIYSKEFEILLDLNIKNILDNYQDFPTHDKKALKKKFHSSLKRALDLIHNKKALCLINFDSVTIFKFFQALSTVFDNLNLVILQDKLYICEIDSSRKVVIEIMISDKTYTFFNQGKITLDIFSLNTALQSKTGDCSRTFMIIGKYKLYIEIISKKFKSNINRILNYKNQDNIVEIPINELKKEVYPCRFQLTKEKLHYLRINSGFYSDKIKIICNNNYIKFIEKGESGNNEILWEKKEENEIFFDYSILNTELEQLKKFYKDNPDNKLQNQIFELENYIRNKKEKPDIIGTFWIDFLIVCLKIMTILKETDIITFYIRDEKPLKSEIIIENLGDTIVNLYLAPNLSK